MPHPQINHLLRHNNIMLLQGPMGNFFAEFADWLNKHQKNVHKVNFNGGDWFFFRNRPNIANFQGRMGEFKRWLANQLKLRNIDAIVCFGDCRKQHRIAKELSDEFNLGFFSFEEGYVRPDYITFESEGNNFFSSFLTYLNNTEVKPQCLNESPQPINSDFQYAIKISIIYYLYWLMLVMMFPFYRHHRGIGPVREAFYWIRSGVRRLFNAYKEKMIENFVIQNEKQYFIFTLQVHNDFQLLVHSEKKRMEVYIHDVIESFAHHAPISKKLVIKHHPMDRGYTDYSRLIKTLSKQYQVSHRILYCCDTNLPNLIRGSLGMVTVNSTTGLQSLFHRIPVKLLGDAVYNIPKLTVQDSLDVFWLKTYTVDYEYFMYFRSQLIRFSQLNGSFHGDNPWMRSYSIKD